MSGEAAHAVAEPSGAAEPRATPYPRDFPVRTGDQSGAEPIQGRADERADLLAYLARRGQNALTMAVRTPETEPEFALYHDRARQIEVIYDEISHGLHLGEVEVAAALAAGTE